MSKSVPCNKRYKTKTPFCLSEDGAEDDLCVWGKKKKSDKKNKCFPKVSREKKTQQKKTQETQETQEPTVETHDVLLEQEPHTDQPEVETIDMPSEKEPSVEPTLEPSVEPTVETPVEPTLEPSVETPVETVVEQQNIRHKHKRKHRKSRHRKSKSKSKSKGRTPITLENVMKKKIWIAENGSIHKGPLEERILGWATKNGEQAGKPLVYHSNKYQSFRTLAKNNQPTFTFTSQEFEEAKKIAKISKTEQPELEKRRKETKSACEPQKKLKGRPEPPYDPSLCADEVKTGQAAREGLDYSNQLYYSGKSEKGKYEWIPCYNRRGNISKSIKNIPGAITKCQEKRKEMEENRLI